MKKSVVKLLASVSCVLVLGACGSASGSESMGKESVLDKKPDVVLEKATGVFTGKFEESYMDVEVDGVKKMYQYVSDMKKVVDVLEEDEEISIAFETTKEGERIIHLITRLDPVVKAEEKEEDKKDEEKEEEIEKEEEKEAEEAGNDHFSVTLEDGFSLDGNKIVYDENKNYYALIEMLPFDTEIKKERWRASPILKEVGNLKELTNNLIPNTGFEKAEFIFAGYGKDSTMYIALKWYDHQLYRFTVNAPYLEGEEDIELELWRMITTVKAK